MEYLQEAVRIPTRAGHALAGTLFSPVSPIGQSMVISSATGMLQKFYRAYAKHFASLGYVVLTFDYRGIGDSGSNVRELRENMHDLLHWGANDQAAAVRYVKDLYPGQPLCLVTHSIGGQVCGFNPEHPKVDRILMVASQSGYWGLFPGWHRFKMWSFWYLMIPVLTPLFGYFPSRLLRLFENLPPGMALQWSQWGRNPQYMMGFRNEDYLFDRLQMPILLLSFPGDTLAPENAVDWLARQYTQADTQHIHYTREGLDPGHFGYFRPAFEPTLWQYTHQWITHGRWEG